MQIAIDSEIDIILPNSLNFGLKEIVKLDTNSGNLDFLVLSKIYYDLGTIEVGAFTQLRHLRAGNGEFLDAEGSIVSVGSATDPAAKYSADLCGPNIPNGG